MKIGIVSDTHGLVRPETLTALAGVESILHMGDVGSMKVLERLADIAPVTAVRGNIDYDGPTSELPETEVVEVGQHFIYMLHNLDQLSLSPEGAGFAAVLYGHTHRAKIHRQRGVLYFNPGSCGPRRFDLQPSVGLLTLDADGQLEASILPLIL